MASLKLNTIEKSINNLSVTKKWLLMVGIGLILLISKTLVMEFILIDASQNYADKNILADLVFYVVFIAALYWLMLTTKKQVIVMTQGVAQAIAEGKLSDYAQSTSLDEVGRFMHKVCSEVGITQQAAQAQRENALKLNEITESLSVCMEIITESLNEEFIQIDQLAAAMNQMSATVNEVASNANSASSSTAEASDVAQEGSQFVDATILSINSLSSNIGASADAVNNVELKVDGIGSVVDTIRSISEQTNLLALNAAIEAARAGEAGRGFAVVADEVRNLAKRTQDATVEIQGMIEQLQTSAEDAVSLMGKSVREADVGVDQVTQAGTQLSGIVDKIGHISDMNYQIASSAEEQTSVAGNINKSLDEVKDLVEGSVAVFKEVTEMAEMISQNVHDLNKAGS